MSRADGQADGRAAGRIDGRIDLVPSFIDGAAGRLFVVDHRPARATDRGADIILLPPFAEEMNRSRRMAALLARALAADGWGVLILDLYGTGDSDGAFADADWSIWCADVAAAADWLRRGGERPVDLMGLRFGGLLAAAVAGALPGVGRLVLWNPVTSGEAMLTQFLRIRLAASLGEADDGDAAGAEDTRALRRRLAEGERVDVAGYPIAKPLAAALDGARLGDATLPPGVAVDWFELLRDAGRAVPRASQRVAEAWTAAGVPVAMHTVVGEPFWSLPEITVAPALIQATRAALGTARG